MRHHQRIVVDIQHPRVRINELRNLMRVVRRGQPSPDVNELPHPMASRQVPYRPPKELPVSHSSLDDLGPLFYDPSRDLTVRLKVILSVQPDVVDPRRMRHSWIEGHQLLQRIAVCTSHGSEPSKGTCTCLPLPVATVGDRCLPRVIYAGYVKIDRGSEIPIHKQIANQLRDSILSGELPAGRRIPSKREITQELNIAGSTVDKATDILKEEGLIRGSKGLGLFVVPENERPKKSR